MSVTLTTIFLAIGGLGFLFLLISLIAGDIFESLGLDFSTSIDAGHDFGVFDSRVIAIFLTAFGGFGAIAAVLGQGTFGATVAGLGGGFAFGAAIFYLGRFLYRQQASSSVTEKDLIGRTAQITVKITEGQVGQVTCLIGEERVEKLARSHDGQPIPAGTSVSIEGISGDSLIVRPVTESDRSLYLTDN